MEGCVVDKEQRHRDEDWWQKESRSMQRDGEEGGNHAQQAADSTDHVIAVAPFLSYAIGDPTSSECSGRAGKQDHHA